MTKAINKPDLRAGVFMFTLLVSGSSWGHAQFVTAAPAPGSNLADGVQSIVLTFSKPVRPAEPQAIGGNIAAGINSHSQANDVILTFPTQLEAGSYTAIYRVLSGDAHVISASFEFHIGDLSTKKPVVKEELDTASVPPDWGRPRIIARALYILGLLLSAGGAIFILLIPAIASIHGQLRRRVIWQSTFTVLAALAYLQISGAAMLGSAKLPDFSAMQLAAESSLGTSIGIAVLGLIVLIGGRAKTVPILFIGTTLLVGSRVFTGHPISEEPGWLLVPAMALHVACAAFWYGSLLPLFSGLAKLPARQAAVMLREFSHVAVFAVIALATAGLLMALVHLSTPGALLTTWYGQLLIMKSTWFAILLAFAAWHKSWLSPRIEAGNQRAISQLRFSIIAEAIVMTLVILISVNLASTNPQEPAPGKSAEAPTQQTATE